MSNVRHEDALDSGERKLEYTLYEWRAEAEKRFGPAKNGNWSFVCPACGHIQSPRSIKQSSHGDPNRAYQDCYGQGTLKDKDLAKRQGKPKGAKADCNWKAYGLFAGPVTVVMPGGERTHTFDFAPTMAAADLNAPLEARPVEQAPPVMTTSGGD